MDIIMELGIDLLKKDNAVLALLKINPKVIVTEDPSGHVYLQYHSKFELQ